MPHLVCVHTIQSQMLPELPEGLQYSHHAWLTLFANGEFYEQHPSDQVLEILDNGPEAYFNKADIERLLTRQAEACQVCETIHIQSAQVGSDGHWASGKDGDGEDEEEPEDFQDRSIHGSGMSENDKHTSHV